MMRVALGPGSGPEICGIPMNPSSKWICLFGRKEPRPILVGAKQARSGVARLAVHMFIVPLGGRARRRLPAAATRHAGVRAPRCLGSDPALAAPGSCGRIVSVSMMVAAILFALM